jgi:CRISPR-associated endonuclease/helicase Cas3
MATNAGSTGAGPIAHRAEDGRLHRLDEHLLGTGVRARAAAEVFGAGRWAELGGFWHDLGKYSADFQRMISGSENGDGDAHIEGKPGRVNHSSAGAPTGTGA